jgi:hypothetical protein
LQDVSDPIDYGTFGRLFVVHAVTDERVRETVAAAAGGDIRASVKLAGGLVAAEAAGELLEVAVERLSTEPLRYLARLSVRLDLIVRVARIPHRYRGTVAIPLHLTVHTTTDLVIEIDIADVSPRDIDLELQPSGAAAGFVSQVGQVSAQVRKQVALVVNERKDHPATMRQRRIDLGPAIEAEWSRRRVR